MRFSTTDPRLELSVATEETDAVLVGVAQDVSAADLENLARRAELLADHLRKSKKLRDVEVSREGLPQPQLSVDVDRTQLAKMGVQAKDLFATLQV